MTDAPAAIRATYSDFKLVRTRKVAQLVFEVPIEGAEAIVNTLGLPRSDTDLWVAIARLQDVPTPQQRNEMQRIAQSEEPKVADPMVREAGMLAKDPRFRKWVAECVGDGQMCGEADAAEFIRHHCGIESRRELSTNPKARAKWVKLRGDFYAERSL